MIVRSDKHEFIKSLLDLIDEIRSGKEPAEACDLALTSDLLGSFATCLGHMAQAIWAETPATVALHERLANEHAGKLAAYLKMCDPAVPTKNAIAKPGGTK